MSIFMRKIPKAAIALLCLLAVFTWLTLSPMTEAQAVAVVDDLTIWGLIALLSGWGVSFAAKDATKTDLLDTMRDLLDKVGVAAEALTEGAAIVASPGILKLRPSLVAAGAQVVNWIKDQVGSGTGSYPVVQGGISVNGTPVFSLPSRISYNGSVWVGNDFINTGESFYQWDVDGTDVNTYFMYSDPHNNQSQNYFTLLWFSQMPFTVTQNLYARQGQLAGSMSNGATFIGAKYGDYYIATWYHRYFNALTATISDYNPPVLGEYLTPQQLANTLSGNTEISGFSVDADLTDAAAPTAEPTAPVYVTAPGLTYDTPAQVADSWYDHVTSDPEDRTYPVTQAVPNIIDAAAIQSGAGTAEDIDPDLDPVIGLVDVFPFCIPFDIYNFLALFNHTREAPSVTIPLALPEYIGGTQEITIDLSSWDSVARILRTVELIAFIVGLAFETRKFIKW